MLHLAVGASLMSVSAIVVALNAQFLRGVKLRPDTSTWILTTRSPSTIQWIFEEGSEDAVKVAGVDGCPDGWIAAVVETDSGELSFRGFRSFEDLLAGLTDAVAIGVDVPIGLTFSGERQADKMARKLLPGKTSSVFSAPHPAIRYERSFANAVEISRAVIGKGISQQLLGILPKIAEVNDLLEPADQSRVFEVHPEVSFATLNNGLPVKSKKGTGIGFEQRFQLLSERSGFVRIPSRKEASKVVTGMRVNADDSLDAIIAAWTARRFAEGMASRVPEIPEYGFRGLRAEIVY